jgi:hypothetical protein
MSEFFVALELRRERAGVKIGRFMFARNSRSVAANWCCDAPVT